MPRAAPDLTMSPGGVPQAPTIIVIGEVVRLRATLDWLGAGEAR